MELKLEDGKIMHCPRNVYILGLWQTTIRFHNYRSVFLEVKASLPDLRQALAVIFEFTTYLVLTPVMPFIRGYFDWRRAVRLCEAEIIKQTQQTGDKE